MKPDSTVQDEHKNKSGRKWLKRFIKAIACLVLIMVLAILAVLLLYAVNLHHIQHMPDLDELLIRLKLAKFPESVRNIHVDIRPCIDDGRIVPNIGEMYVRFEAEPNDIENFINNSPGIDKSTVHQAGPSGPLPESEQVPAWWPTNDSTDRRYFVIVIRETGIVDVYDGSNTVRIWAQYVINPHITEIQNAIEDIYDEFVDFLEDMLHEVMDLFD